MARPPLRRPNSSSHPLRGGCLTGAVESHPITELASERIFVAEFAPYAAVFPRAAAVVLAGGIGSIGLPLRAQLPMLLTPLFFDQADNAERTRRLGTGKVVPFRQYSADTAYQALKILLADPSYRKAAAAIGTKIATEDGLGAACDRIEGILDRHWAGDVLNGRSFG